VIAGPVSADLVERLSRRARELGPSAARTTVEMSDALSADGREVLGLYGSPHWLPPEHVLEAADRAIRDNTGMPAEGYLPLRLAVAERIAREKGIEADGETQVLVTNAANHGLYVALTALLDPGDEVVMYSPHYYYQGIVRLAGGASVYAPTTQMAEWAWNADALRAAITPRTKVVVVNTPTNPTGYVATEDDLAAIVELATERDLLLISDEAYDHTIYDGRRHLSLASVSGARDRTLTVISATKSYAMKHWRMGFLVSPPQLMPKLRDILEWNCFMCNHVAQHAALAAVSGPQDWIADISRRFERCRGLMSEQLRGTPGLDFAMPQGGPFIFLDVGGLAESGADFHRRLLVDHGVPTDPGGPFGSESHLRLPFGGEPDDVREAGTRIAAAAEAAGTA
jgi:aspartate/methionine/tyrosine aminotransferase